MARRGERSMNRRRARFVAEMASIAALLIAVQVVILAVTGNSPTSALRAGFEEALGDWSSVGDTLALSLPLSVVAAGTALAFHAGMFNLGGEGQFIAGALTAAVVGTEISGLASPVHITLALSLGAVAGAIPAATLGWLRGWHRVDEVLSTLMANFLIVLVAQYLVTNPLRDPSRQTGTTRNIEDSARFGRIVAESRLTWAIVVVAAVAGLAWWLVERSRLGYAARMTAISPPFAATMGLPVKGVQLWGMAAGGAFAGLGGAIVVTASQFRFWGGIGSGIGFTAVLIALLAGNRPLAAVVWATIFTVLTSSARGMELETGVPSEVTDVALAVVLLLFAGRAGANEILRRILRPGRLRPGGSPAVAG